MTFDYKNYSLSQLREWVSDALCSGDINAQEIYDTINSEVSEYINGIQKQLDNSKKLQSLLMGNRDISFDDYDSDDLSMFYSDEQQDSPKTWTLTVEVDGLSGESFITLPDELIELKGWKEDDVLNWIGVGDCSYELQKVNED